MVKKRRRNKKPLDCRGGITGTQREKAPGECYANGRSARYARKACSDEAWLSRRGGWNKRIMEGMAGKGEGETRGLGKTAKLARPQLLR